MNKLIIKNVGYDFQKENINYLSNLNAFERLNVLYILPNYSLLESARIDLVDELGAIQSENIMTFDDLAAKFSVSEKTFINRNEGSWIIKKILEKLEANNISTSIGTSMEIFSYILLLKSNNISPETFEKKSTEFLGLEIISKIYTEYSKFLTSNNLEDDIGKYFSAIDQILGRDDFQKYKIIINGFIEFRPHELELIRSLTKNGNEIVVQYPFNLKRENSKIKKIIHEFKEMGFDVVNENYEENLESSKLAFDLLSSNEKKYNQNVLEIVASRKYYEVREIFSIIKEKLETTKIENISIIADESYEDIIKRLSRETDIPISIMNEEKGRDLPLIQSILNFLELVKEEEKGKLISYLLNENLSKEFSSNREFLLENIRILDYKGIYHQYRNIETPLEEFFKEIGTIIEKVRNNPFDALMEYVESIGIEKDILTSYDKHKDTNLLKNSLKALDLFKESLVEVSEFSNLLKLTGTESLEILIDILNDSTYYSRDEVNGVQVLRPINSIGNKSEIRFICGLDIDYPRVLNKSYLLSDRFKGLFDVLNIYNEDIYESFDKDVIVFAQNIGGAKELICSHTYSNPELKKDKSIFLKDLIKRINPEKLLQILSVSMVKNTESQLDTKRDKAIRDIVNGKENNLIELNYLKENDVRQLDNAYSDYKKRKLGDLSFWGDINTNIKQSNYSPKMLEFYRSCPFKFFMKYILNIEPLDIEYVDEFNLEKGNYFHKILKNLYETEDVFSLNDEILFEKINKYVNEVLEEEYLPLEEKAIQINVYNDFLLNFVKSDILLHERIVGDFKPIYFEKNIYKEFNKFILNGFVDRVDMDENGNLIVIDYKTSGHPTTTSVLALEKIQLPIYSLILGKEKIVGAFYGSIQNQKFQNAILLNKIAPKSSRNTFTEEKLEQYFEDAYDLINCIHENIKIGKFQVEPLIEEECKYCDYEDICRKEEANYV